MERKKTIGIACVMVCTAIITTLYQKNASFAMQKDLIRANIEVLAEDVDAEDCFPKRIGSHQEVCRHVMNDGTQCERMKIVCDSYSNTGCSPFPCPLHP